MHPLLFLALFLATRLSLHILRLPFAPWIGPFCTPIALTLPWPRSWKPFADGSILVISQLYSAVYVIAGCDLHNEALWNERCVPEQCWNVLGAAVVGLMFVGLVIWERGRTWDLVVKALQCSRLESYCGSWEMNISRACGVMDIGLVLLYLLSPPGGSAKEFPDNPWWNFWSSFSYRGHNRLQPLQTQCRTHPSVNKPNNFQLTTLDPQRISRYIFSYSRFH